MILRQEEAATAAPKQEYPSNSPLVNGLASVSQKLVTDKNRIFNARLSAMFEIVVVGLGGCISLTYDFGEKCQENTHVKYGDGTG